MPQGRGSTRLRGRAEVKRELVHDHGNGRYSLTKDGRDVLDAHEAGQELPLTEPELLVMRAVATEEADRAAERLKDQG